MTERTLTELIATDPLKLSEQDIHTIVSDLRSKRAQFNLGEKSAGSAKGPSKASQAHKAALKQADALGLDIDL